MPSVASAGFGEWVSPISPDSVAADSRRFEQVAIEGRAVYWVETRPLEGGRSVVMRSLPGAAPVEITPEGFNARTLVNSYGGGAIAVCGETVVFAQHADPSGDFTKTRDQRLYRQDPGRTPVPITRRGNLRYADGVIDAARQRIYCVMESSERLRNGQSEQSIVAIDLAGERLPILIARGADLYASPRLSPDGRRLAWIEWDYPSMPWDGTRLHVAELDEDGRAARVAHLAGHGVTPEHHGTNPLFDEVLAYSGESIVEPRWSPDGELFFVSDRLEVAGDRWWNIHRIVDGRVQPVTRLAREFAAPPWRLGGSSFGFGPDGTIFCAMTTEGTWSLGRVDIATGEVTDIASPFTDISHLHVGDGFAAFVGGSFTEPATVVRHDFGTGEWERLPSSGPKVDPKISKCYGKPETIRFATGPEKRETAHAFYYPPLNPDFAGLPDEHPPLVIQIHGGPTGAANASLNPIVPFFTSRGFAVVDVNYRGSTGFGRRFRQRLYGDWGICDIDDCVAVVEQLCAAGKADRDRVISRGGSAGGYTTLALATFTGVLKAAASYYGVSDVELVARETDKLEARYVELLVRDLGAEGAIDIYRERSPLYFPWRISCPIILFQGLDDTIVPPDQARVIADSLRKNGLPVAAEYYEGEGHGFRIHDNIVRSLEEELSFYGLVLGFRPAGDLQKPVIENLRASRASS